MTKTITAQLVRRLINYDPATGVMTWRPRTKTDITSDYHRKTWNTRYAGRVMGSNCDGYLITQLDGRMFRIHRLAWLWMTGAWPLLGLDHIDGNRSNNVWSNLREATQAQNNANRGVHRNNKLGFKGVKRSGNRYVAQIGINGATIFLGSYETPEQAAEVYAAAATNRYGPFARVG